MQPGGVEFIDPPAADGPAELPSPPPRRVLRVVVVAVLVVGGVAWAVTRHTGVARPITAPSSASPSPSPSPSPSSGNVRGLLAENPPAVTVTCAPSVGCAAGAADVSHVVQAIAAQFPTARVSSMATSVHLDHGSQFDIAQRIVDAHIDSVDVLLRIRPYLRPVPEPTVALSPTPPGLGSALFQFVTASFVVVVQWTGTDSTPPPVARLQALAEDPRLEQLE